MSTLIVSECVSRLTQYVKPIRSGQIKGLRPHLFITGSPAGTIRIEITDENDRAIATSAPQNIAALKTLPHAHKYVAFDVTCPVIKDQVYGFHLVAEGGYVFNASAYVGICLDWDDTKVDLEYSPLNDFEKPLDFESWVRGRV